MAVDLVVTGGKVVTHREVLDAAIAIDRGKVVALGASAFLPPGRRTIDVTGKYVFPGLVDPHIHYHFTERPFGDDARSETQAAVGGGVTTHGIFIGLEMLPWDKYFMPPSLQEKVRADPEKKAMGVEEYRSAFEQNAVADCFFHVQVSKSLTREQAEKLCDLGITSFKLAPVLAGLRDDNVFNALRIVKGLRPPAIAMVHCENVEVSLFLGDEVMKTGRTDHAAYNDSRPRFVETEYMSRVIWFAKATGCPIYIVHITIGEGPELLAWAKAQGVKVIGETCPQYLTHNCEDPVPLLRENPVLTKVNPPLRDKWSNERLWEGIKLGLIESIGTDHSPRKKAEKMGTVWQSRPGLGNLTEITLPIMLTEGYHKRGIPLTRIVELCSYNPARFFGIYPRKGSLAPGSDADLVVVDLEKRVKLEAGKLHSRCDYNIYEGWECRGWPVMTLLRGQVVMQDGVITGKPGIGQYIPR